MQEARYWSETSTRLTDLVAPIGKGTRGLIVSPPKAGKTAPLEHIARAICAGDPETRLIVLLIDERPEEVTHFRRAIAGAEVFASSSDQPMRKHVELSELMLTHIRTQLECNREVVVLVDSLTRLVRAFNLRGARASPAGWRPRRYKFPAAFLAWPATLRPAARSPSWPRS